jgi:iron complex transport system substrate-binding protein
MHDHKRVLSRRDLLIGAAACSAALVACGGGSDPTPQAAPAGSAPPKGPWAFTDDRGERAEADAAPTRIVAQSIAAAALWDFGIEVVGIFGPQLREDGTTPHPSIGNIDLEGIEDCGQVYDELWYVTQSTRGEVEAIAPNVGISLIKRPATEPMARFRELALSLGADLEAPAVRKAKQRYEAARAAVRDAAEANPGLKVLAAAPNVNEAYLAKPEDGCDLQVFQDLGVDLVEPGGPEDYWETISLEQLDKYPADLIMIDVRTLPLDQILERAEAVPTWARLPAVEAGQVVPWYAEGAYGYDGFAGILEELAEAVRTSDADLV